MPTAEPRYWPYPVLPPEQRTEEHVKQIRFLDEAHAAGFRPCAFHCDTEYQARAESGRYGWLVYRGHVRQGGPTRWEVWLDEPTGRAAAFWVDDFDAAAAAVLGWLRGGNAAAVVDEARPRIIRGPRLDLPQPAPSAQ